MRTCTAWMIGHAQSAAKAETALQARGVRVSHETTRRCIETAQRDRMTNERFDVHARTCRLPAARRRSVRKADVRDCGMIRGERTEWLAPGPAMIAGGMEAWPSESSGGLVYLKARNKSQ